MNTENAVELQTETEESVKKKSAHPHLNGITTLKLVSA